MSNADMLQYCDEALAWDDFGPVDIFFFESVKKIITGQCSAFDSPDDEEVIDDLMGIERPVRDVELEPDYDKYADIFYGEDGEDEVPDYSLSDEDKAFADIQFSDGFFDENEEENGGEEETENTEDANAPDAEPSDAEPQADNTAAETDDKKPAAKKASVKSTVKRSAKKSAAKTDADAEELSEENKHEENTSGSFTVNI